MINLDDRQKNLVKSIVLGAISLFGIMLLYVYFVVPIQDFEMQRFLAECEADGYTCSVEPSMVPIALGVIPFLIFLITMNILEKKRIHNWRSWK